MQDLIQWGIDNNMESFISRYRNNIILLLHEQEKQTVKQVIETIIDKGIVVNKADLLDEIREKFGVEK